jgi:hypothetical protein
MQNTLEPGHNDISLRNIMAIELQSAGLCGAN